MFKSSFGRGLVAAMENIDGAGATDEVIPAADSAETSLLETAEAGTEVTGTLDDIESASTDADSLGAIADTMEATEETGGMDPVAAQVAEVAVESICARLGVQRRRPYAMESFGDKSRRVSATRYAVEEIKDVLKRIWDAVKAAFGKVKEFLKNFFKALFDSNEKLAQRADALLKKATAVKGSPKEKDIPAGSFGKSLAVGGTFEKTAVLGVINTLPKTLGSAVSVIAEKPDFASKLKELVANKSAFDGYGLSPFQFPNMKMAGNTEGGVGTFVTSDKLPGNRTLRIQANSASLKGSDAFTAIGNFKAELGQSADGKEFDGERVEALNDQEIIKIATAAGDLAKAVIATRKTQSDLDKEISTLQNEASAAATASPKEDESGASDRSKTLARALSVSVQFQIRLMVVMTKYCTDVTKSGLDYAERSLSNFKEGSVDKDSGGSSGSTKLLK